MGTIRIRTLQGFLAASLVVLGWSLPEIANPPRGFFVTHCGFSHSLRDDPIMRPGAPGASHRHEFFGSVRTNARSTERRMRTGATTCALTADTAAYWFPSGSLDGVRLRPTFSKAYYFGIPDRWVAVPPPGMQMIGGNPEAANEGENPHATWTCGASGPRQTPIADHPYDCRPYAARWPFVDSVVGRVDFPNCWNGTGRSPEDVVYQLEGRCPPGFGHRLPAFRLQIHYGILNPCRLRDPCGPASNGRHVRLRLSSGPYHTLHADFWNTWRQRAFADLIRSCLYRHRGCGVVADRA